MSYIYEFDEKTTIKERHNIVYELVDRGFDVELYPYPDEHKIGIYWDEFGHKI